MYIYIYIILQKGRMFRKQMAAVLKCKHFVNFNEFENLYKKVLRLFCRAGPGRLSPSFYIL